MCYILYLSICVCAYVWYFGGGSGLCCVVLCYAMWLSYDHRCFAFVSTIHHTLAHNLKLTMLVSVSHVSILYLTFPVLLRDDGSPMLIVIDSGLTIYIYMVCYFQSCLLRCSWEMMTKTSRLPSMSIGLNRSRSIHRTSIRQISKATTSSNQQLVVTILFWEAS